MSQKRVSLLIIYKFLNFFFLHNLPAMPRKVAAPVGEDSSAPRRSTRIKEQPRKQDPVPKKAPSKPRAKKEAADKEEKPKSARGNKRKAEDEPNGMGEDAEEPATKKVCFCCLENAFAVSDLFLGKACFICEAILQACL